MKKIEEHSPEELLANLLKGAQNLDQMRKEICDLSNLLKPLLYATATEGEKRTRKSVQLKWCAEDSSMIVGTWTLNAYILIFPGEKKRKLQDIEIRMYDAVESTGPDSFIFSTKNGGQVSLRWVQQVHACLPSLIKGLIENKLLDSECNPFLQAAEYTDFHA